MTDSFPFISRKELKPDRVISTLPMIIMIVFKLWLTSVYEGLSCGEVIEKSQSLEHSQDRYKPQHITAKTNNGELRDKRLSD